MATKNKNLKAGMLAGMAAEKGRTPEPLDRFALAEQAIAERPGGLLAPAASPPARGEPNTLGSGEPLVHTQNGAFSAETSASANGRRLERIPLASLLDNPLNARRIYDPEVVQDRAASIATHGQKTPGLATPVPDRPGFFYLIDGHYRKRALLAANKPEMECFIEADLGDLDLYRLSFMLNEQRSGQSALDNAIAWRQLIDENKISKEEEISELTGISPGTISKTLALLRLPDSVIGVMKEKPSAIGIAAGYELTLYFKLKGEEATRELAQRIVSEGLSSREVEAIRRQAQEGRTRKVKEISRQYKIRSEQGEVLGTLKEWDSGRVVLDIQVPERMARGELVAALKARFAIDAG
jgi:ParB family chromosome partitioning protein